MNTGKQMTGGLDYFRIPAALLVIAIHTSPLASYSEDADYILVRIFARIAVPFFLMVTGYFLLPDYLGQDRNIANNKKLWRNLRKLLILYGSAILIYLPVNLYSGKLKELSVVDVLLGCLFCPVGTKGSYSVMQSLIFRGTFYHLWYFPGIILGIFLIVLLAKRLPYPVVCVISCLLYLIGLFGDNYYGLIADASIPAAIYDGIFKVCVNTRNGIFFTPVFLVLGAGIRMRNGKKEQNSSARYHSTTIPDEFGKHTLVSYISVIWLFLFLLMYAGMIAEGMLIKHLGIGHGQNCMYLLLLPCMYCLIRFLLFLSWKPRPVLRTIATWVYILHPLSIILVRGAAKVFHLEKYLVEQSMIHYIAVSIVTFGGVILMELLWKNIIWKKMLYSSRSMDGEQKFSSHARNSVVRRFSGRTRASEDGKNAATARAWIEVDREHLQHNIEEFRKLLPPECELMPAVKANAYGHGAVEVAKELYYMGIRAFCVASVDEAVELRRSGIQGDILILGITPMEQIHLVHQYHLIQTVVDAAYAKDLNTYGKRLAVHIKIDTGMHRLGEWCEHIDSICQIYDCANLDVQGIYTHLCCAESESARDKEYTYRQYRKFMETIQELTMRGYHVGKRHILASSGLLHVAEFGGDYARLGIAMYGVCSNREESENCKVSLLPVMSVKSRVEVVKHLQTGESAGYDLQYTADSDRELAVLSIGYADGIPRSLSCGHGKVLIHDKEALIVGRICMDQMLVDVTGIEDVKCGDIATIMGSAGKKEITAYDLAEMEGTITNEILSRMGSRLNRIVV